MRKPASEALQEASALFAAGRLDEAKRACRRLLAKRPDIAEVHLLLGEIHRQGGDEARARECTARVLKLRPDWGEAHVDLAIGDLFGDHGCYAEAEARYRRALELQPDLSDARYNLAGALNASGRALEAIEQLQALLRTEPGACDARERLVRLLFEQRRFDEMEAACREGIALHPAAAFYPTRLGVALWWRGRHDEALAAYRRGAERAGDPELEEIKFLEASALLTLGRYDEGWEAYRWRRTRRALRAAHPELVDHPRALAEPKRLRILCEQGIGDELFFLRFAVRLRERGHRLVVSGNAKLAPLLASMPELFESIDADLTLASGDLPAASGQAWAPPLALPVDAERRASVAARLRAFGPPPYIAVTWRAGVLPDEPKAEGGPYWSKDIPAELLGRALRALDARVVILQRRPQSEDIGRFSEGLGRTALDLSAANDDLRDAVAVLSLVDDYVGVSNTNMHLRAGLHGKSARVLVHTPPEWRWGLDALSSAWFPGFIVYRAAVGKDWSAALAALESDLAANAAALQQK